VSPEWIGVVDTAVKIGLGALISGFSTYFVTRTSNTHDTKSQSNTIKRELILEASKNADEYFDYTYKYFSTLDGIRQSFEEFEFTEKDWKQAKENIQDVELSLDVARKNIYSAVSKLELLGLANVAAYLSSYRHGEEELRQFHNIGEEINPSNEFLSSWAEKYVPIKKQFRDSLSKAFLSLV